MTLFGEQFGQETERNNRGTGIRKMKPVTGARGKDEARQGRIRIGKGWGRKPAKRAGERT